MSGRRCRRRRGGWAPLWLLSGGPGGVSWRGMGPLSVGMGAVRSVGVRDDLAMGVLHWWAVVIDVSGT